MGHGGARRHHRSGHWHDVVHRGTAFETTLLALVIALFVQLWMTAQKTAEERFLDDCTEYCLRQIVNRIKILPFEQSREA